MDLTKELFFCTLTLSGFFIACLGTIIASVSLIKVLAMQRSTHSVQFEQIALDGAIDKDNEAFLKKESNSWATSPESLLKQNKLFKEDLKEDMPELSSSIIDDNEVHSF